MTVAEFINKVGFKVKNEDVDKVNNTITGIKDTATKLLGAIGIGFSLAAVNGLVEEFTRVNNQIRNATESLGDQREIQEEIMAAAEATRTSYSDTANVVSMLVKGNSQLFGNVDEAVKFNNAATMLFKSAGKTNEDIASLMEAINKSFQKGYVDSETISQLLERAPEAVALLNKRLGTTSDQLEDMATEGTMTVEDLKAAFIDNIDEIEAGFGNVQYSVTDALTVIRSKWGLWLAQTNETLGITDNIGRFMVSAFNNVIGVLNKARNGVMWLADKLGGVDKLFRVIAIAAGAAFTVFNFSKITSGLSSVSKLLTSINLKTLAIIAVIILIALLVEDFINFMQGNDSLIGSLLEKAGVDVEAVRETIINAWNAIKSFLLTAWDAIKKACSVAWGAIKAIVVSAWNTIRAAAITIFGALQRFFEKHGDSIKSALSAAWSAISTILATAWNLIKTAANIAWKAVQVAGSAIRTIIIGAASVFGTLADAVSSVISFFQEHEDAAILLGVAVATLTALVVAYNAATIASKVASMAETAAIAALIAKDYLAATAKGVLTAATTAWTAVTTVATAVASAFGAAIAFLTSPIGLVILAIGALIAIVVLCVKHWDQIKEAAAAAWEWIKGAWASAGEWFNSNVVQPIVGFFTGLWSSITETVTNIKDTIVNGFTAAIDWIKSLPAQAIQWGADIIQGIVDGITGAIGKVGEAVSGVASKIKSFLGFSKPDDGPLSDFDTYMPDMIDLMTKGISAGKERVKGALENLTEGMSGGVDQEGNTSNIVGNIANVVSKAKDGIKSALKSAAGTVSVMTNANIVSPKTAAAATGTSQVSKSVVQNIEINNKFEGDRAGQQKSSEAMDKAAKDSTAELARGLAYAR